MFIMRVFKLYQVKQAYNKDLDIIFKTQKKVTFPRELPVSTDILGLLVQ